MAIRRILIVAAAASEAGVLSEQVTLLGHDVAAITRSHGEAIAASRGEVPDLVLMDQAPRGNADGESADWLRRQWNIPVVFLLDSSDGAPPADDANASCDYIMKPFTPRELGLTIELALSRHDAAKGAVMLEDHFFAHSIDMFCFLDFNGYFKRLNPAWERTLGFTLEELRSRPFIEFVHPDDRERTLGQNARVRAGGQALAFENRYRCKDGSYRWFRWNAASNPRENVVYSVARDVTESKRLEGERERLVGELQDALSEVRTLRAILPMCSYCKKIRDDADHWETVEAYVARHTSTRFSHGICPTCLANEVEPQFGAIEGS